MASKSQKTMSQRNKVDSDVAKTRQSRAAKETRTNSEMLPSDRNETTDINPKIAFLAYN